MVNPWNDTLKALVDAPGCTQHCKLPYAVCPPITSEDCLFMNIFTPLNISASKLPVMFFIHGGDYKYGSAGGVLYDGSTLASTKNVVVVSVQYRIGALGFLWTGFGTDDINGNFGAFDQELGLRFVQQVIDSAGRSIGIN